ncbi:hypothetical protein [Actinacidiphila sp. bgisy160]
MCRPGPDRPYGRGLLMVNRIADPVRLRATAEGTTIRFCPRF